MKFLKNRLDKPAFIFFSFLFITILILFRHAFSTGLVLDDYFFVKVSQVQNIKEFLNFFSPFKDYFYRPIPTEIFYFTMYLFKYNLVISHLIVFISYFVGILYLYRNLLIIFKTKTLSALIVFMYSISLTHVFQLFIFNTFQEICLFTFLSVSFYYFLNEKRIISLVFFIFALLSKETAVLFPAILICYELFKDRKVNIQIKKVLPYILFSIFSLILYKSGLSGASQIPTYQIHISPPLIINNSLWYWLWGLGFPNFLPDYMRSILFKPLPEFWNLLNYLDIRNYFYFLIFYLFLFTGVFFNTFMDHKKELKKAILLAITCIVLYFVFITPTLFITHKWMVRLTVSLVFLSTFEGYVIYKAFLSKRAILKISGAILIAIYIYINILGIKIHESSGLVTFENKIFNNSRRVFSNDYQEISKYKYLYFADTDIESVNGSEKLKVSYHGEDFTAFFLPGTHIKALYAFEEKFIPKHSFVIESSDIVR